MMTRSTLVFVAAAACIAGVVVGCNSSSKSTQTAAKTETAASAPNGGVATPKQVSMGVVNSKCPMMLSHPAGEKVTTEFQGQKVGLCCAGCMPAWNKLSDAEKAAALAKAK